MCGESQMMCLIARGEAAPQSKRRTNLENKLRYDRDVMA